MRGDIGDASEVGTALDKVCVTTSHKARDYQNKNGEGAHSVLTKFFELSSEKTDIPRHNKDAGRQTKDRPSSTCLNENKGKQDRHQTVDDFLIVALCFHEKPKRDEDVEEHVHRHIGSVAKKTINTTAAISEAKILT